MVDGTSHNVVPFRIWFHSIEAVLITKNFRSKWNSFFFFFFFFYFIVQKSLAWAPNKKGEKQVLRINISLLIVSITRCCRKERTESNRNKMRHKMLAIKSNCKYATYWFVDWIPFFAYIEICQQFINFFRFAIEGAMPPNNCVGVNFVIASITFYSVFVFGEFPICFICGIDHCFEFLVNFFGNLCFMFLGSSAIEKQISFSFDFNINKRECNIWLTSICALFTFKAFADLDLNNVV